MENSAKKLAFEGEVLVADSADYPIIHEIGYFFYIAKLANINLAESDQPTDELSVIELV